MKASDPLDIRGQPRWLVTCNLENVSVLQINRKASLMPMRGDPAAVGKVDGLSGRQRKGACFRVSNRTMVVVSQPDRLRSVRQDRSSREEKHEPRSMKRGVRPKIQKLGELIARERRDAGQVRLSTFIPLKIRKRAPSTGSNCSMTAWSLAAATSHAGRGFTIRQ